jgi:hypothetical protein
MKAVYNSEIEGMVDFWKEIEGFISYDYRDRFVCNTDGRTEGCLLEFKLNALEEEKNKTQLLRYARAFNSTARSIPRYGLLISLNQRIYKYFDFETKTFIKQGKWSVPLDLLNLININENAKGWIDIQSVVSYNDYYYKVASKKASKDDFIKELKNPSILHIAPYIWNETGNMEKALLDQIGPTALRKRLGAFFTPEYAVAKTTKYIRNILKNQPDNNYVIVDRCAGTGNLEQYLTDEELSHCILNTYVFAEWNTLNGLYKDRCVVLPEDSSSLQKDGTLSDGDALSEKFCEKLKELTKGKRTIFLENPPYFEPQSEATRKGETQTGSFDNFVTEKMKEDVSGVKTRELANKFIWSAFELLKCDYYIVYAPVKYWKSQHIIDKKFIEGFLANREDFHASEAGISAISWKNENTENNELQLENCLLKKVKNGIGKILPACKDNNFDFVCTSYSGVPDFKHGFLASSDSSAGNAGGVSYCEANKKNIQERLPLFVANCYSPVGFLEKEVVMKSGDGGLKYLEDTNFINDCIVFTALTQKNKCVSSSEKNNEMCFDGNAKLNAFYVPSQRSNDVMRLWDSVVSQIKNCEEYNSKYNYGLFQIINEININVQQLDVNGACVKNKKGEIMFQKKYPILNENISLLKKELDKFYNELIVPKLFEYELLK